MLEASLTVDQVRPKLVILLLPGSSGVCMLPLLA